jgi:DNA-binding SARP family transcriptional activator
VLSIRLLGPLEIDIDGSAVPITGPMTQAVLVRLALDAGSVVSRDGLIDALWGDHPPAGATNALQAKVSELRRMIGSDRIVARRPGYLLDVSPESVDALVASSLISQARQEADANTDTASQLYARALAMWRGPALSSVADLPFATIATAHWHELRLAAFEERARLELAAGRLGPLVAELEAAVAEHPMREPLVELLMLALCAEGRQVSALAAYRELRVRLVDELGIDPSPRLQTLERQVLQQDPSIVRLPTALVAASSSRIVVHSSR